MSVIWSCSRCRSFSWRFGCTERTICWRHSNCAGLAEPLCKECCSSVSFCSGKRTKCRLSTFNSKPRQFSSNRSKQREQRIRDEMKPESNSPPIGSPFSDRPKDCDTHETESSSHFVAFVSFCAQPNCYSQGP